MTEQEFGQMVLKSAAKSGHKQARHYLKYGKCSSAYLPKSIGTGQTKYASLLELLSDGCEMSAHEVSDATGIEWKYVSVTLAAMKKSGHVTSRKHESLLAGNRTPLTVYAITQSGIDKAK